MRSIFTGAKKCGGAKRHKERSPTVVLRSLATVRRRTLNGLLNANFALTIYKNIFYFN